MEFWRSSPSQMKAVIIITLFIGCLATYLVVNVGGKWVLNEDETQRAMMATSKAATRLAPPTPLPTLTTPIPITADDICSVWESNPFALVTIRGMFYNPGMTWKEYGMYSLLFGEAETFRDDVQVFVTIGERNGMDSLPGGFSGSDFRFHTDDDQVVGLGDEVILTATMKDKSDVATPKPGKCNVALWVIRITLP